MLPEGSREIEAVKQRLTAAKTQAALAKAMSEAAEKEVKVAEKCLKDAEKRWEVIEVDSDDESHSIWKYARNTGEDLYRPVEAMAMPVPMPIVHSAPVCQTDGTVVGVAADRQLKNNEPSPRTVFLPFKFSGEEVHWGHTVFGVSGTYRRMDEKQDGVAMYRKEGLWNGEEVDFVMYRGTYARDGTKRWFIGVSGCATLFVNTPSVNTDLPSRDGWVRMDDMKLDGSHSMESRKRKVSLSPSGINAEVHANANSATDRQTGGSGAAVGVAAARQLKKKEPSTRTVLIPFKFSNQDHWGHTVSRVNGPYERTHGMNDGVAMYRREGSWNRLEVDFVMFRGTYSGDGTKRWFIGVSGCAILFLSSFPAAKTELPPRVRWVRMDETKPTPEVRNVKIPS